MNHKLIDLLLIVTGTLAFAALVAWALSSANPRDDTDTDVLRSGMRLYTDHGTGCQYLRAGDGLTPRLDSAGKPMCKGGAK